MTAQERWRKVDEIYHHAADLPHGERDAFLEQACLGDEEVRREVLSLLEHAGEAESFLETGVVSHVALMLAGDAEGLSGQTLGAYRLISPIGAGGMGCVYLAEDTRLERQVAVKVLLPGMSADTRWKRRFEQEAKIASGLNHPGIVTVHDIGQDGGVDFLVMELVRGETLAKRIPEGGMPVAVARRYAIEMTSALGAAHAAGIVHRDLKPGNVMIAETGAIKVLDFGLAKTGPVLRGGPGTAAGLSGEGAIVGTVAYMSPEQAKGLPVDARTDIFSFGAVLYEMLTGRRAFEGESNVSTLAAVLDKEPEPLDPRRVPREMQRIVNRCLAKSRDDRFRDIAEVSAALEAVGPGPRVSRRAWGAGLVAAAATAGGVWLARGPARIGRNRPVELTDFPGEEQYPSLSPDGRQVVFSWKREGEADIFVMPVDHKAEPKRLTERRDRQAYPRWSPDGRWIAYTYGDSGDFRLALIPAAGGLPKELGKFSFRCIEWTAGSDWIIATHAGGGKHERLALVSPASGEIRPIPYEALQPATRVRDVYPALSPDGKSVAFSRTGGADTERDLFIVPLAGGKPRRLTHRDRYISGLCFTPDGAEVLFQSSIKDYTGLFRVPVSGDGGREPPPVAGVGGNSHYPVFAGPGWKGPPRLLYSIMAGRRRLVRLDFAPGGTAAGPPRTLVELPEATAAVWDPSLSPDGRHVAYTWSLAAKAAICIVPSDGGPARQLTSHGGNWLGTPVWSPDGRSIAFSASPGGQEGLHAIPAGGGPVHLIATGAGSPYSYSPDGRWLYFFGTAGGKQGYFRTPSSGGPYEPGRWQRVMAVERVGLGAPSPDGRSFLFATAERRGIFSVPVGGGEERLFLPMEHPVWFAVTGEWVYYLPVKGESELTTLPKLLRRRHIRDGRDEPVGTITVPMAFRMRTSLAVDPGGRFVVFTEYKPGADLMLVDGFR